MAVVEAPTAETAQACWRNRSLTLVYIQLTEVVVSHLSIHSVQCSTQNTNCIIQYPARHWTAEGESNEASEVVVSGSLLGVLKT